MRTLIATAALLAMAGAAQAQVTLYGLVDLSYGKGLAADLAGEDADLHSGGDNGNSEGNSTTRVGIKGSLDVGSGVKANFRLESNGITSDGEINSPTIGRQMWAGFSGGFGEVRLGRQDSVAFQTMIDFDFNGASNGVSAGAYSGVGAFYPGRQSRSLQYISPSMSGFTVQLGFQPEGNAVDADTGLSAKSNGSVGVKWASGPLAVGFTAESKRYDTAKDFYSLAASYDFGVAKVMASYADGGAIDTDPSVIGGTGRGWVIGAVAPVAGFNVGFHYAKNTDDQAKIDSTELFINKEIFKNTYAYAEAGHWKSKALNLKADGYAVGVIWTF